MRLAAGFAIGALFCVICLTCQAKGTNATSPRDDSLFRLLQNGLSNDIAAAAFSPDDEDLQLLSSTATAGPRRIALAADEGAKRRRQQVRTRSSKQTSRAMAGSDVVSLEGAVKVKFEGAAGRRREREDERIHEDLSGGQKRARNLIAPVVSQPKLPQTGRSSSSSSGKTPPVVLPQKKQPSPPKSSPKASPPPKGSPKTSPPKKSPKSPSPPKESKMSPPKGPPPKTSPPPKAKAKPPVPPPPPPKRIFDNIPSGVPISAPTLFSQPPGFKAPPDYLAPFPPAPPALPLLNVGPIRNIEDVCRVCMELPYNGTCSSTYAKRCLSAINRYRIYVLQVTEPICKCYQAVVHQLVDYCPFLNLAVNWLGNCDPFCFYGPRCPFVPLLYAMVSPKYVDVSKAVKAAGKVENVKKVKETGRRLLEDSSKKSKGDAFKDPVAAPAGAAGLFVDLHAELVGVGKICFRFIGSDDLTNILQIVIRKAVIGDIGSIMLTLYKSPTDLGVAASAFDQFTRTCVDSKFDFMETLSENSTSYYVQIDTVTGSLRGQLLTSLHLVTAATSQMANATCPGSACLAVVDTSVNIFSVSYAIRYLKLINSVVAANVYFGRRRTFTGQKMFDFFGPGIAPVSEQNAITVSKTVLSDFVSNPYAYYANITTTYAPNGALRGQFGDSVTILGLLYGYQVVPPSDVSGFALFNATVGAGGICYTFKFFNVPISVSYAYLHQGDFSTEGQVVSERELNVLPGLSCIEATVDTTGLILNNANKFYVQVYSDDYPLGALRGQLYIVPGN